MAVFYHCSCVAPSLVKIGKTRRTPPGRWDVSPGPGGAKKAGAPVGLWLKVKDIIEENKKLIQKVNLMEEKIQSNIKTQT